MASSCSFADLSKKNDYRDEYDQSVARVAQDFNPDVRNILMMDEVGKSLMFLPITKIEVLNNGELELFTEFCSRRIRIQQSRGGTSGLMPFNLASISAGTCSGD